MIRRISLLSKKEDDEEEDPFGWEQRSRGIGVLPDIVEEEAVEVEKPSKIVRIKPISTSVSDWKQTFKEPQLEPEMPTESIIGGLPISTPEDKPKTFFEGLPETGKKIVQMLGGMQGFKLTEPETYKQIDDISKQINEQPDKLGKIAKAHELLTGESIEQSLEEMSKPTLQRWDKSGFTYQPGVGEIEFTKLPEKFNQAQALVQQAMQFSTSGKIGDVMRTVAQDVVLGYLATTGLKALYRSGIKVEGKMISGKKLEAAMGRAQKAYISETNKFKASLSGNDFEIVKAVTKIVRTTGVKAGEIAGVKVPQRVLFGQPAGSVINVVKIIQNAGKITQEVSTQLSMMPMTDKLQVMQELSKIDPTLVASIATDFASILAKPEVKAVEKPEGIPEPAKVTPPAELKEVLKEGVKAPWKMTKKEYIGDTIWIESAKNEHIQSVVKALGEGKPVPAEVLADYPDLKAKVKPITITPAPAVEPVAVKKEAVVEPTPKVAPAIPAELEGLAEDITVYRASAKPFNKDVMDEDGIFVTPDKTFAERWQKSQKYGNLEELTISANAKILKREDIPKEFTEVKNGNNIISDQDAVIKYAKENGYDGYEEYGIDSKGNIIDREIAIWNKDKITLTAPVAEKAIDVPAKVEVKAEIVPEVELATPAQIQEADIFAKEHKLITKTPSGKLSDLRYKRLAKNIIGKTSIKDMTKEEANEFIEAIQGVVQRRPWEPPIIPLSTKIVPKEFFEIEFKEPDISKIITPKKFYLRILGAEPLLKPLIDSYELLSLKTGEINKWINDVIKKINKEATTTQKFKARVFNRPTDKVATMRDLLDKHENPPDSLTHNEKEIFKEVRDFTKDILIKTNEVRDRVGLEPIKDIKTYIPHFLDELAKQIVNKKYPFPEDVKYWLGRNMPKKIYNPTAIERRVRDDLENFFSKDLGALLKTLAKYDLRDIYLSEPYSILRAELNALGDKIPASLRKEIDLFLKHDIFNYPTELDQMLNRTLERPTDVINFFLKPFNRILSNPISSLSNVYRQGLMGGAIAMKPRLVLRNLLTQKLLNMNIYPVKDYLKAQFWLTPKGVMDEIRDTTFYKLSIRKFEDLPPLLKPVQWGMWPYSKSHAGINYISNVDVSGKVGYYYGEDMIDWCETSKGKAYIEKYAKKHNLTGKAKNDLTWRKGDEIDEAVEAMSVTQWLYFSTDMPRVFRGKGARAFWSLQSWWMNWFGKHLREGLIRMGGKTSRGRIVRPGDRINLIKGLIIILALTEGIRKTTGVDMKRFLFFPFPAYIYPPAMQLMLNTYYLITANTDQKRKSAINGLKNNLKLLIPFSGATKRWWQYIKGEITLKEWLFYVEKKEEKKKVAPTVIGKPSVPKITIPKISIGKIKRISPVKSKF